MRERRSARGTGFRSALRPGDGQRTDRDATTTPEDELVGETMRIAEAIRGPRAREMLTAVMEAWEGNSWAIDLLDEVCGGISEDEFDSLTGGKGRELFSAKISDIGEVYVIAVDPITFSVEVETSIEWLLEIPFCSGVVTDTCLHEVTFQESPDGILPTDVRQIRTVHSGLRDLDRFSQRRLDRDGRGFSYGGWPGLDRV